VNSNFNDGKSFAIESTLSGLYFKKLIKLAKSHNYIVKLVYIYLDNPSVCIERIKERVLKGGHNVPDKDVIRRYFRSKNNFWNIYKNLVDKWFLIYNSDLYFMELAIGQKENFIVNNEDYFQKFIKDIKVSHES
jgi:predicted ABC-type ATPase